MRALHVRERLHHVAGLAQFFVQHYPAQEVFLFLLNQKTKSTMNFISPIIEDCNKQLKNYRGELRDIKTEMKRCGEGTLEFLKLKIEDIKNRIRFHAGLRSSIVRNFTRVA